MIQRIDRGIVSVFDIIAVRLSEWCASFVMLTFALVLSVSGDTFASSPAYSAFQKLGFDEVSVAVPIAIIAILRMTGLIINGHWHRSPMLRLLGAIFGASLFSFLAYGFLAPRISGGMPALSTGFSTYAVLALTDMMAAYRAGRDARKNRTE